MLPSLVLALWLIATLGWWAFAFAPLPSDSPPWLTAARYACFGESGSGLPGAAGWMLLVLTPLSFLVAIVVLWSSELGDSLRRIVRSRVGHAVVAVFVIVALVETTWVAEKIRVARRMENASAMPSDVTATLPADYPRRSAAAPDFALVDQHGRTISLAAFKGRPVVISFVFAHCQALCPIVVETLKRAAPHDVVLITLDPWRDTVSTLPSIARQWQLPDSFHVLSAARVDDALRVVNAYGVPIERDEKSGDIVHPGLVFVVDADGRLAYTFNNPSTAWIRDALARLG
jgi:protein SCO1